MGNVIIYIMGVLFGLAILAFGGWTHSANKSKAIRSDSLITPRIELIIIDNQVDTVYVYEPS